MPKRSKGNRNWNSDGGSNQGDKYYYEHDDRVLDAPRRVTFRPSSNRVFKKRNKSWELIRGVVEDDDVDMMAGGSNARGFDRFKPYGSKSGRSYGGGHGSRGRRPGRNSPAPHSTGRGRRLTPGPNCWYKVTLPHGGKYTKEYILRTLTNYISPLVFIPISYKINGNEASFYIEDFEAANEILNADRRITLTDGFKLVILVKPGSPNIELNDAVKNVIKQAMVKRYNPATKALDLSKFHSDPDLNEHPVYLQRPTMLGAVLDVVAENIPELSALDLSDNRLGGQSQMSAIANRLPAITVLHMGRNKINRLNELDGLKSLKLVELVLEGNPVCQRYQQKSAYISDVRKMFPKVIKLDGTELPPPIGFEVEEVEAKIPPSRPHFACSEEGRPLVQAFLEQYYGVYDSESRLPLADAYHELAYFSLCSVYSPGQSNSTSAKLNTYISESRNLVRVTDSVRRRKLLHTGRQAVVNALSALPRTEHDPLSFTFDLLVFSQQLMVVAVSGLFREPGATKPAPVRSFSRVMVIVPHGVGMCITNDELLITNATPQQLKVAFQPPKPVVTPVSSPVANLAGPTSTVVSPIAMADDAIKQQVVEALAQQTVMNLIWSKKCLDDTNWDPQMALHAFSELGAKGLVPTEAFIK